MIDIEFTDRAEKHVRDSWKELLDHHTVWGAKTEAQRKVDDEADIERSDDLLADMLAQRVVRKPGETTSPGAGGL